VRQVCEGGTHTLGLHEGCKVLLRVAERANPDECVAAPEPVHCIELIVCYRGVQVAAMGLPKKFQEVIEAKAKAGNPVARSNGAAAARSAGVRVVELDSGKDMFLCRRWGRWQSAVKAPPAERVEAVARVEANALVSAVCSINQQERWKTSLTMYVPGRKRGLAHNQFSQYSCSNLRIHHGACRTHNSTQ